MPGGKVFLVRHGETAYNEPPERIRAWADVPLTAAGRETAHQVAEKLAKERPVVVFSSDLSRAMQTAHVIAKAAGLKRVIPSRNLRPWDVGEYTGRSVAASRSALVKYIKEDTKPVPGGESFKHFVTRYLGAMQNILAAAKKHKAPVVVVTHIRNIRVTLATLGKGEQSPGYFAGDHDPVEPGGYITLQP